MGIHEATSEIRKSENRIFKEWLNEIHDSEYHGKASMDRDYFNRMFGKVAAAMETDDQGPRFRRSGAGAEWDLQASDIIKEDGISLEFFLTCFKVMIRCIEHSVSNSEAALIKLRRIADCTELAAVAQWEIYHSTGAGHSAGPIQRPKNPTTPEKILSAIFFSVGEGILLVDQDFEVVKTNPRACEIYGLLEQNLIGTDIRTLTDESGAGTLTLFFQELIEGQRISAEIAGLYVDGKTFPSTVTVTRSDLDGKRYWPIIVRDNTEHKILEKQLRQEKQQTEEMNLTLKTVLKSIEQDKKDFENRVATKIRTSILPGINKIGNASDDKVSRSYLTLLEQQLLSLTKGFENELHAGLLKLTRTEMEICRFIQAGCSTKDICNAMRISYETVQTHRKNIRKKLELNGRKLNLHTYLMNRVL